MLYLFDIDGTLVDTGGAGMESLRQASYELFGDHGPELNLAGSTDLGIVSEIHSHFRIESTDRTIELYFATYLRYLDENLASGAFPGRVLPGVAAALARLAGQPDSALGLLTGNISAGAASKMNHFGLSRYFAFGAYGCDHSDRNRLGPIALQRAAAHTGRSFAAEQTWVIGDTPKDVACAHAIGARCLAVATGLYSVEELQACGADRVVADLEQEFDWS